MQKGYELLTKSNAYSKEVVQDFEKVLGSIPKEYKELVLKYKTGYPSISVDIDVEVVFKHKGEAYYIESFHSLVSAYERLTSFDRSFGLSANHRKYKLLPICTSGSSYREYFLNLDTEKIYCLDPNQEMVKEIEIENYKIANNLIEFILGFESVIEG